MIDAVQRRTKIQLDLVRRRFSVANT